MKPFYGLMISLLGLYGCDSEERRAQQEIHNKVQACAANFGKDIQTDLRVSSQAWNLKGKLSTEFKEESQAILFSCFPPSERLKAYEDYIQCIENSKF